MTLWTTHIQSVRYVMLTNTHSTVLSYSHAYQRPGRVQLMQRVLPQIGRQRRQKSFLVGDKVWTRYRSPPGQRSVANTLCTLTQQLLPAIKVCGEGAFEQKRSLYTLFMHMFFVCVCVRVKEGESVCVASSMSRRTTDDSYPVKSDQINVERYQAEHKGSVHGSCICFESIYSCVIYTLQI